MQCLIFHKGVCRHGQEGWGCGRPKRARCPLPLGAGLGSYQTFCEPHRPLGTATRRLGYSSSALIGDRSTWSEGPCRRFETCGGSQDKRGSAPSLALARVGSRHTGVRHPKKASRNQHARGARRHNHKPFIGPTKTIRM